LIKLRLAGGLGNQLFQISAMLLLRKLTNLQICIYTSALKKYKTKRELEFTKILNLSDIQFDNNKKLPLILRLRLARLIHLPILNIRMISDRTFQKAYLSNFKASQIYADGYFIESVSQEIFDEMLDEISKFLKSRLRENISSNVCIIHVRGGDFLKLGWELPNIKNFYAQAIREVLVREPDIKFEIISDDPDYAQNLISDFGIQYNFIGKDIVSDFCSIINARFAILSNSTFAFWAGALRIPYSSEPTSWMPKLWKPGHTRTLKLRTESW
jgi:hypothetical protein